MSTPIYDIDEGLWQLYLNNCMQSEVTPNIKDYLIWCDEQDYDRPEVWDGSREATDVQ